MPVSRDFPKHNNYIMNFETCVLIVTLQKSQLSSEPYNLEEKNLDGFKFCIPGVMDDDILLPSEIYWRDRQPWLESCDYQFRPRYRVGWVPSWVTNPPSHSLSRIFREDYCDLNVGYSFSCLLQLLTVGVRISIPA